MPRAASVKPASTSAGTRDRSMGSIPCSTGHARTDPRQRRPGESSTVSLFPARPRSGSGFIHHHATGRSLPKKIFNCGVLALVTVGTAAYAGTMRYVSGRRFGDAIPASFRHDPDSSSAGPPASSRSTRRDRLDAPPGDMTNDLLRRDQRWILSRRTTRSFWLKRETRR